MRSSESKRASAGFWSSARSFYLPVGQNISPDSVRGYPIDFRVKLTIPPETFESGAVDGSRLYVDDIQWGLACYERFLGEPEPELMRGVVDLCEHLVETQDSEGRWLHPFPARHTWPLSRGWPSGMAQGQAASLLVRAALEHGDARFERAALRALEPFRRSVEQGGVRASLGSGWIAEEYPTSPPSYVLNGAIFAIWGMRDVAVGLNDSFAQTLYDEALTSLAENFWRWDTGWWSKYSFFEGHPVTNVASSFYHSLHVAQLTALSILTPCVEAEELAARFASYAQASSNRYRAFAAKAVFRLLIPRNAHLAFRLPWYPSLPKDAAWSISVR